MYMPYLMLGYAALLLLLLVGARVCAWSAPGLRGMNYLSWNFVLALAGVLLAAARVIAPAWLSIVVANQALAGAVLLIYCSAAAILIVPMRYLPWGLAAQAVLLFGSVYYTYLSPNLTARIFLASGVAAISISATAVLFFRYREPELLIVVEPSLKSLTRVMAWLAVAIAAQHIIRIILTGMFPSASFIHLDLIQSFFTYNNLIMSAALDCGLIWMALWTHRRDLHLQARTDSLTGLLNRRGFEEILEMELARQSSGDSLSILLVDIDYFKNINDTWGHPAGDEALRKIGQTMRNAMRKQDEVARMGGEEFVVLLRNTCGKDAEEIAERLRGQIAELEVLPGCPPVTASIGVAGNRAMDSAAEILRRCDLATYFAKQAGRNLVSAYSPLIDRAMAAARSC